MTKIFWEQSEINLNSIMAIIFVGVCEIPVRNSKTDVVKTADIAEKSA